MIGGYAKEVREEKARGYREDVARSPVESQGRTRVVWKREGSTT